MIVANRFSGDKNERVMLIQHRLYNDVIVSWVGRIVDRCRLYEDSLMVQSQAGMKLKHPFSFDHRTVQTVHDLIAACFRHRFAAATPLFDLKDDEKYWEDRWRAWSGEEWEHLLDVPKFFRAIATVTAMGNTPSGFEAERSAAAFLHEWYSDVPWLAAERAGEGDAE